ncbi:Uncharacterised protein [Dorea longicatena]|nr:Uncharacterised protein [Dorea longicatena]
MLYLTEVPLHYQKLDSTYNLRSHSSEPLYYACAGLRLGKMRQLSEVYSYKYQNSEGQLCVPPVVLRNASAPYILVFYTRFCIGFLQKNF